MYLVITIPALIFNCVCNYLSLKSIYKYYQLSEYSPRLLIIAIIIITSFPTSLLSVLTCILNFDILSYGPVCYLYTTLDWFTCVSKVSLLTLMIYVLLILFTKWPRARINKIGYGMIIATFFLLGIFELVLLPYFGAKSSKPATIMGKRYNRFCSIKNISIRNFTVVLILITASIVFFISIALLVYYYYFKQIKIRDTKHKIFLTLVLFSFISVASPLKTFMERVLGVKFEEITAYAITDFSKAASGFYGLTYYLVEVYYREKIGNIGSKFIIRIGKTRKIYKDYCEEKGYRQLWNMIVQWEQISDSKEDMGNYEVLDQKSLSKKEALRLLEKHLDERTYELVWYDPFYYYYLKLEKLGQIDIDLMLEGKEFKAK